MKRWRGMAGCVAALALHGVGWAQGAGSGDGPRFTVQAVQIDGASLIAGDRLQAVVAPLLRREVGFADLEAARAAVEAVYHDAGWRLVRVRLPAQTLDGGTVRLEVLEPALSAVAVTGDAADAARWRERLPALREGQVPNLADLDRQLTLANEHPAQQVQVAFAVPPDGAGRTLRAEIQARSGDPSGWVAFVDNSGNASTGRLRYGLAWRHARLFDTDQQINVQLVSAPHDADQPSRLSLLPSARVRIAGVGWRLPLPQAAGIVDATLGYSSVDSGQLQDLFKVTGRGATAQLRYTQLLHRVGGWQPRAFVALDWRRYDNRTEFGGINLSRPLVLSPLTLGLSAARPATPQAPDALSAYVAVVLNLPMGPDASAAAFSASRAGAERRYRVLRAGGQWSRPLAGGQLAASLEAQASADLLPPGEQFSAGGAASVRGFSDRGISGDGGLRLQLEWTSGNLLATDAPSLRLATFVDAAWARRQRAGVLERSQSSIASAGLGLRLAAGAWTARLDWGQAIHQNTGGARVRGAGHVSLAVSF